MVTSEQFVDIGVPKKQVWEFLSKVENIALWQVGILSVSASDGLREGSRLKLTSDRMGSDQNVEMEITRNDGSSILKARSRSGLVRFEMGYYLFDIKGGTRVRFSSYLYTHALYREAEAALQEVGDARYRSDLARLKTLLESSNAINLR